MFWNFVSRWCVEFYVEKPILACMGINGGTLLSLGRVEIESVDSPGCSRSHGNAYQPWKNLQPRFLHSTDISGLKLLLNVFSRLDSTFKAFVGYASLSKGWIVFMGVGDDPATLSTHIVSTRRGILLFFFNLSRQKPRGVCVEGREALRRFYRRFHPPSNSKPLQNISFVNYNVFLLINPSKVSRALCQLSFCPRSTKNTSSFFSYSGFLNYWGRDLNGARIEKTHSSLYNCTLFINYSLMEIILYIFRYSFGDSKKIEIMSYNLMCCLYER